MAFQPVPRGASAVLVYRDIATGRQVGVNILNFEYTGTGDITTGPLATLSAILANWWASNIEPLIANSIELGEIEVQSLESEEAPYLVTPYNYAGNIVAQILPLNVTIAIAHTTGLTGRSARGRTYLIGLNEAAVAGSYLDGGVAASFVDAFDALRADMLGEEWVWSVLSRYTAGALRTEGVMRPIIASNFTDLKIDTMRRRIVQL